MRGGGGGGGGDRTATLVTVAPEAVSAYTYCYDQLQSHLCSNSQQSPKQEEVDLQLCKDIRELSNIS